MRRPPNRTTVPTHLPQRPVSLDVPLKPLRNVKPAKRCRDLLGLDVYGVLL